MSPASSRRSAKGANTSINYFLTTSELRREHGDRAVDQALAAWQQQRDAVAVTKTDWRQERRGPFTGNYRGPLGWQ